VLRRADAVAHWEVIMWNRTIVAVCLVLAVGCGGEDGCCCRPVEPPQLDDDTVECDAVAWFRDADGDGFGDRLDAVEACEPPDGYVADATDCDDLDPGMFPGLQEAPVWVLDPCDSWRRGGLTLPIGEWGTVFHSGACGGEADCDPALTPDSRASVSAWPSGCSGNGVVVEFWLEADCGCEADLPGEACCDEAQAESWISVRWDWEETLGPEDLSAYDFLLLPVEVASANPIRPEPKLQDATGCLAQLGTFDGFTDLPLRSLVIPLVSFGQQGGCDLDLSQVVAAEVGIAEPWPEIGRSIEGSLAIDPPSLATADDLRIPVTHLECPVRDEALMHRVAAALIGLQQSHGFVDTWLDPETWAPEPMTYTYAQAVTLLYLTLHFREFGDLDSLEAAAALAGALVDAQVEDDGSWYDAYAFDEASGEFVDATGGETRWVGNVAWSVQALEVFVDSTAMGQDAHLAAIDGGVSWLLQQQAAWEAAGGSPGGVTAGGEGNVSAAYALLITGHEREAEEILEFMVGELWDEERSYLWMGVDDAGLAADMFTWTAPLLAWMGMSEEVLDSYGLAQGVFPTLGFDDSLAGVADFGPYQPWWEGCAGWASTGGPGAWYLHQQLLAAEVDVDGDGQGDGLWACAPDDFAGGPGWGSRLVGAPPTAWVGLMSMRHLREIIP